jgi:hypothetical protein
MWGLLSDILLIFGSRHSSVGIATGYMLVGRGSIPGMAQRPERLWGHLASSPMGKGGSFSEGKAAGAWCWRLTSI